MIHINDTDYDAEGISIHRAEVIKLRDEALYDQQFDTALLLSVTVAMLEELRKFVEEQE